MDRRSTYNSNEEDSDSGKDDDKEDVFENN